MSTGDSTAFALFAIKKKPSYPILEMHLNVKNVQMVFTGQKE